MNNYRCFWWEACVCDGYPDCDIECKYYLEYGQNEIVNDFYTEREKDIATALIPVDGKWTARFELYKHLFDNHEL